jgi:hypothetical protein
MQYFHFNVFLNDSEEADDDKIVTLKRTTAFWAMATKRSRSLSRYPEFRLG